jgi:hypothetical protein
MSETPPRPSPIIVGISVLVGVGALVAVGVAYLTKGLICGDSIPGCRSGLMTGQLMVALAGLIPVGVMLWASLRGRYVLALLCFLAAVLLYLAWGVLNDAAVHGWDELKVF